MFDGVNWLKWGVALCVPLLVLIYIRLGNLVDQIEGVRRAAEQRHADLEEKLGSMESHLEKIDLNTWEDTVKGREWQAEHYRDE